METIIPPKERQCERCGRMEVWSDEKQTWIALERDDALGRPHCLHEWDINGSYNPIEGK